jgi:hypothetical protein
MDTFAFAMSIVLMLLAVQFQQNWLVFAIAALIIMTERTLAATFLMVISAAVLYFLQGQLEAFWPFILFGLIILAFALGGIKGGGQPETYPADPYGGMMGGGMPGM